jgi:hypothetical protein
MMRPQRRFGIGRLSHFGGEPDQQNRERCEIDLIESGRTTG